MARKSAIERAENESEPPPLSQRQAVSFPTGLASNVSGAVVIKTAAGSGCGTQTIGALFADSTGSKGKAQTPSQHQRAGVPSLSQLVDLVGNRNHRSLLLC
jgi:hypothetical protein